LKKAKEQQQVARDRIALRKKCEKLALQKRWADEDLALAIVRRAQSARRKARRANETYQVECEEDAQRENNALIDIGSAGRQM
jgi:hypothetical protein